MRVFRVTIKPRTGMGTPLKGDTIFGHICWQAAYDEALFGRPLGALLDDYTSDPFVVVSSAYPVFYRNGRTIYAFKRPDLPFRYFSDEGAGNERTAIENRKKVKKRSWMLVDSAESLPPFKTGTYLDSAELAHVMAGESGNLGRKAASAGILTEFLQPRNTINRLTGTTGEGQFAPFGVEQFVYLPDVNLAVFMGLSDKVSPESALEAMRRMGETGFGKDASAGLGKFDVVGPIEECSLANLGHSSPNACYTFSPSVPEKGGFQRAYYTPFIRFGRHGDVLAKSQNPFKNPILMADEGAILKPYGEQYPRIPFIGQALQGLSKSRPETVAQGYSLYIPVMVED